MLIKLELVETSIYKSFKPPPSFMDMFGFAHLEGPRELKEDQTLRLYCWTYRICILEAE
jgi:hypothetical protein